MKSINCNRADWWRRFKIPFKGACGRSRRDGAESLLHNGDASLCFQSGARLSGQANSISYGDLTHVTWPCCASVSSSVNVIGWRGPQSRQAGLRGGALGAASAVCWLLGSHPGLRGVPHQPHPLPSLLAGCPSFRKSSALTQLLNAWMTLARIILLQQASFPTSSYGHSLKSGPCDLLL